MGIFLDAFNKSKIKWEFFKYKISDDDIIDYTFDLIPKGFSDDDLEDGKSSLSILLKGYFIEDGKKFKIELDVFGKKGLSKGEVRKISETFKAKSLKFMKTFKFKKIESLMRKKIPEIERLLDNSGKTKGWRSS